MASIIDQPPGRRTYRLADRYESTADAVLLTGVQAVCRVPLDMRRIDREGGLHTRAYVSGYQGSPLGTIDFGMRPMASLLEEFAVDFRPGMNESLAATAVQGTQSVPALGSDLAGVTGYWYGKAPGVDQALDAIRHGNLMGSHPSGGVVAFVGDDATAKSSTVPGGSERTLRGAYVPVLVPSDPQDVLSYGLHAVSLSRATGLWSAVKIATNVADGSALVIPELAGFAPVIPEVDGGAYRHDVRTSPAAALAVEMERNLHQVRIPLAIAYAERNGLNTITHSSQGDRIGVVAAGYPYRELRQSLSDMHLGDDELAGLGIRVLKIGMAWPLDPRIVGEFAAGLDEILVIEDKGPFLESLLKEQLYNMSTHPRILGTHDEQGRSLLPSFGGIDADTITRVLGARILARTDAPAVRGRLETLAAGRPRKIPLAIAARTPYFCSGCPHNLSTKVPEDSLSGAGIGCHGMVTMMEPSQAGTVTGLTQMGGEGAQWNGQAPYLGDRHLFQNLGDGTLAHSATLAIRSSVAAGVDITYKILYNAAVAMTGGQDAVGGYTVPQLCRALEAEGVRRVIVTSDHPEHYRRVRLPTIAEVRDRDRIDDAQRELGATSGVTVLVHDQPCAAEQRRKRKRGLAPEPATRVVINERICEGCGDCGRKSNCLSVVPTETEFGRKTRIDQASCNKDYSCVEGDCPAFLKVTPDPNGAGRRRHAAVIEADRLPLPDAVTAPGEFTVRITGIGGTGVVTLAQVLATAGFLEGLVPHGLDQVGLSQKAGPVVSDVKFTAERREDSNRISAAGCDVYLGCDLLVAGDTGNLAVADPGRTVAVVSTTDVPNGAMIRRPESAFPEHEPIVDTINDRTRREHNVYVDASRIAGELFGGGQFANMLLLGVAYQVGAVPLDARSVEQAIKLNGVAVDTNIQAFRRGRQVVTDPAGVREASREPEPARPTPTPLTNRAAELVAAVCSDSDGALEAALRLRVADLVGYQSKGYAERYLAVVARAAAAEKRAVPHESTFTAAVAVALYKLMAYKDEYEVARLALDSTERAKVRAEFGERATVSWVLHPPILRALGMRRKISLGSWFTVPFLLLRGMRRLRGTWLDVFGYSGIRKAERGLVDEYIAVIDELADKMGPDNHDAAVTIAELPDMVRGYEQIKLDNIDRYHEALASSLESFVRHGAGSARR
ncbi:MAG: indolepyruvate ferredoxin oxidoreductase family protein [Nocardioidaceae bacterium]